MSQGQLSRRLGVKKSTLSGWEQDLSEPRANKLSMMSGLLNVSMTWLLTGEGDGMPEPGELELEAGDFSSVLSELRELRAELRAGSDRAARLEKKLRNLLQNAAQ
ncbi:XRE family transcriptional regulator [Phaeobacter gallaeciensis]|uniref:XRE family transcriptional regulator n=2 Tax=Roseobacteraceae TaxID=2854170 RepID=A0A1B0ZN61_9RHOB|nr:XRE family transcriptional regulator [Phaeobacter gallaeciensis]